MSERSPKLDASIAVAIMAQHVGAKVVRDAMFLSSFRAASLPRVIVASAVLSLAGVLFAARLMTRKGPARVVPAIFALNALAFAIEWALAPAFPGVSAIAIYLHTAVAGGLMISGFWSIVNERFDPHVARRNISRITTGTTFGCLVGGLGAKWVAEMGGPRAILLMLAVISVAGSWGVAVLGRSLPRASGANAPSFRDGIQPLVQRPYLRRVVSMVVVVALLEILLDCALKTTAETGLHESRELVGFFSLFHTGVAILTFVVQIALSRVCLEHLGLGATLAILPAAVTIAATGAAISRTLITVAVAAGIQTAIASSLFRSAYEILFTPIPAHRKRALKVVIDVAFPRLGAMLGSAAVALVVAVTLQIHVVLLLGAAALGVLGVVYGVSLHRMYIAELGSSLQLGIVTLREKDALDATTRHTIMSTMHLDRARLLAQIEASRRGDAHDVPGGSVPPPAEPDEHLFEVLLRGIERPEPPEKEDFDVCYANARALAAICAKKPSLAPDRGQILELARAYLSVDDRVWRRRRGLRSDSVHRAGMHRGLEHVFLLLGLALERDVVKGCLAALNGTDRRLRGTALEYLENVLPNDIGPLMRARIQQLFEEEDR